MPITSPAIKGNVFTNMFAVKPKPELKELYAFSLINAFAYSLITIFEPVFFYQQGFSLSFIALYYAIHYSIYVFMLPLGGKFIARFGSEYSLVASLPLFIFYFLTLAAVPDMPWLVYPAILLLTLHKIFYWPAFHTNFSKLGDSKNRGTELSWMNMLRSGVGILGPLVGGFVAALLGFPALFILAAMLVLLSAVPLLKTKEKVRVRSFAYSSPWRMVISRKYRNMLLAMLGMGENLIDMVYWPILFFIILGSTSQMGMITALTIAIMTAASFLIGEASDRMSRRTVLRLHIPFMMIGYLLRPLAISPMRLFLTDALGRLSFAGINIPMVYRLYAQSNTTRILSYIIAFEIVLAFAKAATAFLLVWVFAAFVPFTAFVIAFVLAALMTLMYFYL